MASFASLRESLGNFKYLWLVFRRFHFLVARSLLGPARNREAERFHPEDFLSSARLQTHPHRAVMEDLLALLIEVEDKMKQLYLSFSSLFSHLPEVRSFWERMAFHELRQAHLLAEAKDLVKEADLPGGVAIDLDRVQELSQMISLSLTEAKKGVPLSRAFAMALDLEREEAELPWMMLTALGKATMEEALRDLHGAEHGHLSQLQQMMGRFSGSEDPGEPKGECG